MNIVQLLAEHNVPLRRGGEHHHVREGWVGVDCPWCGTAGKYHLGISLSGWPHGSCWRCGPHRIGEILDALRIPRSVLKGLEREAAVHPSARPRGRLGLPAGLGRLQKPHRRYLRRRGFDPEELERLWGVMGIGIASRLSWRIWIPVVQQGETVSWTTRSIGDGGTRYVSAKPAEESVPIKTTLYGLDYVRQAVVICEGPTDVWRVGPGAVATYGTAYTAEQLRQLSRIPYRLIAFDADAGRQADGLAERLTYTAGETAVARLGSDAGSATDGELQALRAWLDGEQVNTAD